MSIAAKSTFIKNLSQKLGDTLTVNEMSALTSALAEELSQFEMEHNCNDKPDVETGELLDEFLAAKEVEGKSPKTIAHYKYILTRMFKDINLPIRDIMIFSLRRYLAKLKQQGMQDVTVEGIRSIICSFFGWVHRENLIDDLIDGLTFDLTAAFRTMRDADTGIKKSEVIVDFRHSADRRTRIPVRRFLVD